MASFAAPTGRGYNHDIKVELLILISRCNLFPYLQIISHMPRTDNGVTHELNHSESVEYWHLYMGSSGGGLLGRLDEFLNQYEVSHTFCICQ